MSIKKKLQVFVSSTYRDLKIERQAAVEAILKAGHIPAGMELFSAGNESQLETIRRWIDESDVYMLISGGRYGSVEPNTSLSYTELEYDYAVSQGKPVFAVVITDEALNVKVQKDGRDVIETESTKELKLFREKVLSRISSFFSDTKDIKLAVHETLSDFQARYKLAGWIPARDLPDMTSMLEEMQKLRKERDEALSQLSQMKLLPENKAPRSPARWSDNEFNELIELLEAMEINTKAFNKNPEDPPIKVNVLGIFDVMRDKLITGVTNSMGIKERESLLYFNVCPKLEMHELAAVEKVSGVAWQRYRLTAKGKALLVFMDKQKLASESVKKVASVAPSNPDKPDAPMSAKKPAAKQTARRKLNG
ncbi:DUF4062 domain-containing protein [Burkholderia metallica]|uniref:DUF4062 domain-containing protein n=1 Tax=Burkholderia metallica TaxID=488729 RepID=UPI001ABBD27B|nr:DUF4062 domain-containing protein [Burkholderia metallica]